MHLHSIERRRNHRMMQTEEFERIMDEKTSPILTYNPEEGHRMMDENALTYEFIVSHDLLWLYWALKGTRWGHETRGSGSHGCLFMSLRAKPTQVQTLILLCWTRGRNSIFEIRKPYDINSWCIGVLIEIHGLILSHDLKLNDYHQVYEHRFIGRLTGNGAQFEKFLKGKHHKFNIIEY